MLFSSFIKLPYKTYWKENCYVLLPDVLQILSITWYVLSHYAEAALELKHISLAFFF